jgi:hypothetical protein
MPLTIENLLALPIPTPAEQAQYLGVVTVNDPDAAALAMWNGVLEDGTLLWEGANLAHYRSSIVTALTKPDSIEAKRISGHDLRFVIVAVFRDLVRIGGEGFARVIPPPWRVCTIQDLLTDRWNLNHPLNPTNPGLIGG